MDAMPWQGRRLHILGIAGAGMSGLAVLARGLGAQVTGSDSNESDYLIAVRAAGIEVAIGHATQNVPDGDVEVVRSTAVPDDNPERVEARRRGLPDRSRHQLLREICAQHRVIAIAGAHGKTTTTAMTVHALRGAGEDPSYLIGGILRAGGSNVHRGDSPWLVIEADESDRSFLETHPEIAVVTNFELDHHSTYGSREELAQAFREFLSEAREQVVWNRPALDELLPDGAPPAATPPSTGLGAMTHFDRPTGETTTSIDGSPIHRYDVTETVAADGAQRFAWHGRTVRLRQPGIHNAWNAAAALTAVALTGADIDRAVRAMEDFPGTGRRYETLGTTSTGAVVVDDYAHHPTEVARTLEAAREMAPRRLVAVFQPHLYSRTQMLAGSFGEALAQADVICVLDVYRARERPEDFPGVSGLSVARAAADAADGRPVLWLPTLQDAKDRLPSLLQDGDLCLCLGAGDVDSVAHALVAG